MPLIDGAVLSQTVRTLKQAYKNESELSSVFNFYSILMIRAKISLHFEIARYFQS